jgi:E1A/CREB-binding protein
MLFRHCIDCTTGDCPICKGLWSLLKLHARNCRDSKCTVPKCRYIEFFSHAFTLIKQLVIYR